MFTWNVLLFVGETAVLRGWIVDKRVATSVTAAYGKESSGDFRSTSKFDYRKESFKAWLFTLNIGSILSLQMYFERSRKLSHEPAVPDFCPRLHNSYDRGIPDTFHLKLQQLISGQQKELYPGILARFLRSISERQRQRKRTWNKHQNQLDIFKRSVHDYLIVTFYFLGIVPV